nr:C1 family peptidase [Pelagibacterales bacterium]
IYEEVFGATPIDFNSTFELEPLKVEDQNGSSSCVGQAWAKYLEVLERKENNVFTDLSAKYIYSQIYLPNGGAYIREGAKIVKGQGCSTEKTLPSYPSTEENMRDSSIINNDIRNEASIYRSKSYASITHKESIDLVAQAIIHNNGVVTGVYGDKDGWKRNRNGWVIPPKKRDWGHAIFLVGYGIKEGRKYIKFINSWSKDWGNAGYGYLTEDYFESGNVFSLWTLVDLPNPLDEEFMYKRYIDSEQVQFIVKDNDLREIPDPSTLQLFMEMGWISPEEPIILTDEDKAKYDFKGKLPSSLICDILKNNEDSIKDYLNIK